MKELNKMMNNLSLDKHFLIQNLLLQLIITSNKL